MLLSLALQYVYCAQYAWDTQMIYYICQDTHIVQNVSQNAMRNLDLQFQSFLAHYFVKQHLHNILDYEIVIISCLYATSQDTM